METATIGLWLGLAICLMSLIGMVVRDWRLASRGTVRVMAEVVDHESQPGENGVMWAAVFRMASAQGDMRIVDTSASPDRRPAVGTMVELTYPEGSPERAAPRRPLSNATIYGALLLAMVAIVLALTGAIAI